MEINLIEDLDPDLDFYYQSQFKIYHDDYLIWDKETWEIVFITGTAYRIEVDGKYAGDIISRRKRGATYILDFSILPEYQGKGIGKAVLEQAKKMGKKVTAVTRKETLNFFLKSGFVLKKVIKNFYAHPVDGYYIIFEEKKEV